MALLLIAGSRAPATAAPVTQLKILSFNIWVQGGLSLNNCIEAIRTSGADIVGLQECNASTAQVIASSLNYYVFPASDCTIVSRYPIIATGFAGNSRGVTVELSPGQRVHLFNCHLTPFPYGPYDLHDGYSVAYVINEENQLRLPEVNQILDAMQDLIPSSEPCFVTGDFNAPSHLDYASVPWPTSVACINAGLVDSYRELHPANRTFPGPFAYNDPGITWTPKLSQEPDGVFDRIDFVYYSPGDGATPVTSAELDERNSINPWPSDHRAVLTTFSIVPPVPQAGASLPSPANGAAHVELNPVLRWLPGSNAVSHAVYFGVGAPTTLLTNTASASVPLTNLLAETVYRWRVDESTPGGTVTGETWSFTTVSTNAAIYEWNFAGNDLSPSLGNGVMAYADGTVTSNLVSFGTSDGVTVPDIGGVSAAYLHAPAFTGINNGLDVWLTDSGPNGGGAYINQFTIICDVLIPGSINWFAFFNTNPWNSNDADFYVNPDGALGIAAIGYSASGLIAANTWYRVAFTADLTTSTVTYYLNGASVRTGSAALDGRFSLYSNMDPGADLLLLNEGDTSGTFTHEVYLSCFSVVDRTLSAAEIAALGGPKAGGIFTPGSPIKLSMQLQPSSALLHWNGGSGPYEIQVAPTASGPWTTSATTNGVWAALPRGSDTTFFRIRGH